MRLKLHHWILLAMVLGAGVGLPLNYLAEQGSISETVPRTIAMYGKGVGDLFLRLLKMIVVPLIFTSLISGVIGTGNLKGLGRLGGRTITFYLATSMMAIVVGIVMVNIIQPGKGADLEILEATAAEEGHSVVAVDEAARNAFQVSCLYALEGRHEKALDGIERFIMLSKGSVTAVDKVRADPDLERLRGEPRYEVILSAAESIREDSTVEADYYTRNNHRPGEMAMSSTEGHVSRRMRHVAEYA